VNCDDPTQGLKRQTWVMIALVVFIVIGLSAAEHWWKKSHPEKICLEPEIVTEWHQDPFGVDGEVYAKTRAVCRRWEVEK
jgi:hypothetical protein